MPKRKRTTEERADREQKKAARTKRRNDLRKAGICVQCGTRPHINGHRCQECLQQRAQSRQAKSERAAQKARDSLARSQPYLDSAEIVWTEAKWLARATGAGYEGADQDMTDAVFGPFWQALPDGAADLMECGLAGIALPRVIVTQAQADIAREAGLQAYRQYTERTPITPTCPQCGDDNPNNRRGNDYHCGQCDWEAMPGTFGAVYIGMQL